jgi:hypothetical protein
MRPPDPPDPLDPTSNEQIRMVSMSQSTTVPDESNTISVSVSYMNYGWDSAKDASFAFDGLSSSTFTLMGTFGGTMLGTIAPQQTVSLSLPLYVSPELPNGNHQLRTVLTYTDALNETQTVETMIFLFIRRPESASDSSVPRVIISRHSVSEELVTAGNPFELSFTLTNTSRNMNVINMKVTVTDADGIFLPVAGINSFYVEELQTGGSVDLSITLSPKQDAESKSYPVTISLAYEDRGNTQHTVSESLSIPVYQPQRLEISNMNFFGDGTGKAQLSFQFINKGKAPLYNLTIKLDGPMTLMEGEYFVGNFAPGSADFFEDDVFPELFGEVSGFVVLQYEDAAGNPLEYRQEISAWIDGGFDPGGGRPGPEWPDGEVGWPEWPDGENGWEEDSGGKILGMAPWLFWTLLGVLLPAGGTAAAVIIIRKKRQAKDMTGEDDDE